MRRCRGGGLQLQIQEEPSDYVNGIAFAVGAPVLKY